MLINIIGCDGSGKTTQFEMLKPWIEKRFDLPVRKISKRDIFDFSKFPECSYFGCSYKELMYDILPKMKSESRSLFLLNMFAVSVASNPPRKNEIVILDGGWQKHLATEAALGVDLNWLNQVGSFFPKSDLSFFLDIPVENIIERRHLAKLEHAPYECGNTGEISDKAFLLQMNKVRVILKATAEKENWHIIDAQLSKSDIFKSIRQTLEKEINSSSLLIEK